MALKKPINKWIEDVYNTDYDSRIPYDNDSIASYCCFRVYKWKQGKTWKDSSREYIVGDDDIIYDENGIPTTFIDSNHSAVYYVVNPIALSGCKNREHILNYFKVRSIGTLHESLSPSDLRFVCVSLKIVFEKESVNFGDIFDLYEPEDIGEIKLFLVSQARCVFAYLCKNLFLIFNPHHVKTINKTFEQYDILTQFTNAVDSIIEMEKDWPKSFNGALKKKKSITMDEKETLLEKKRKRIAITSKNNMKTLVTKLDTLEENFFVATYVKLADTYFDKPNDKLKEKMINMEAKNNKCLTKWLKLHDKLEELTVLTCDDTLAREDVLHALKSELSQLSRMILEEYLPSSEDGGLFDNDDTESIEEYSTSEETDGSSISEESDEDLELYDSEGEDNEGDNVVDWDALDEQSSDSEADNDNDSEIMSE